METLEKIMGKEFLNADIRHLTETIRPPLSQEEYEAAQYVAGRLREMGVVQIEEQPFYSIRRVGERLGLTALLATFGTLIAGKSKLGRFVGVSFILLAHFNFRRALTGRAIIGEWLWPQRRSQNILAYIPQKSAKAKSRVVLLAHLDTDIARFSARPEMRPFSPYLFASLPVITFLAALLTATNATIWLRRFVSLLMVGQAGLIIADEIGPDTTGANDNASGVSLLLCLAEELARRPLKNTEVVLAFTGCETAGCNGAAELAAKYGKSWEGTWWLAIDSVGAGELCWVTEQGWSNEPGSQYHSNTEINALLTQVAAENPTLGVIGRPLRTVNAVGPLVAQGCKATAVMGYERAGDTPVNWRQLDDTPDELAPDTQQRAYQFVQAFLTKIDEDI
jgi:hypothetical protein